ncbi:MAG: hypothetical protein HY401_00315 [Elusimicrobia bacterium]|nr:hypothetical protein [Elusimicrobiota bacterium]
MNRRFHVFQKLTAFYQAVNKVPRGHLQTRLMLSCRKIAQVTIYELHFLKKVKILTIISMEQIFQFGYIKKLLDN